MEGFAEKTNGFEKLNIFAKRFIIDACQSFLIHVYIGTTKGSFPSLGLTM